MSPCPLRLTLVCLVGGVLLAGLFLAYPAIDISVSSWFYAGPVEGFWLSEKVENFTAPVRYGVRYAGYALGAAALLAWAWSRSPWFRYRRVLAYLALAIALGPGLVVNVVFKDHFGRARPATVMEFGGDKHFTLPFELSDQCKRNCSFVSGDAAAGFVWLAPALLASRRRRGWICAALAFGSLVGFGRIAQGRHFLSDVIFAGVFTIIIVNALYCTMFRSASPPAGLPADSASGAT